MSDARRKFVEAAPTRRRSVLRDVARLIQHTSKWWLVPILLAIGILGLLMVLSSSGAAPFIYTLF